MATRYVSKASRSQPAWSKPTKSNSRTESHMRIFLTRTAIVTSAICCTAPAFAQSTVSDVLNFLVTNQSIATGSPQRDRAAAQATSDTIARSLRASLATLPISTSSGGFVYRLDPDLGTMERRSASFGPVFVERASGAGRGSTSIGLTLQHMRFDSLDGRALRNGSLV